MTFNVDFLRAIPKEPERDPLRLLDIINQNKISIASIAAQNTRAKDYASAIEAPKQFQVTPELIAAARSNQQQPQDMNSILSTMRQIKDLQGGEGITPYQQAQIDLQYAQLDAQNQENEATMAANAAKQARESQEKMDLEMLRQRPDIMKAEAANQQTAIRQQVQKATAPLLQDAYKKPANVLKAAQLAREMGDDEFADNLMKETYSKVKMSDSEEKAYQETLSKAENSKGTLKDINTFEKALDKYPVNGITGPIEKWISPQDAPMYYAVRSKLEMRLAQEMKGQGQITENEREIIRNRLGQIVNSPEQIKELLSIEKNLALRDVDKGNFTETYTIENGSTRGAEKEFEKYREINDEISAAISPDTSNSISVTYRPSVISAEAYLYDPNDITKYYRDNNLAYPAELTDYLKLLHEAEQKEMTVPELLKSREKSKKKIQRDARKNVDAGSDAETIAQQTGRDVNLVKSDMQWNKVGG